MQASRRGFSGDELRLVMPEFLAAVRWAAFAAELGPSLVSARHIADTDPSKDLLQGGPELVEFMARRSAARERVKELDAVLYPPDEHLDDG